MQLKIPANAAPEVAQAFRDLNNFLRHWETENVGFSGRRIIDAGDAIDPQDYVTLSQLQTLVADLQSQINTKASNAPQLADGFATSGDASWTGA